MRQRNDDCISCRHWIVNDTYQLTMYNYDSTSAITFTIKFDVNEANVDSEYDIFSGNCKQLQMNGMQE
ncbi:MAG: hypothetical protein KAI29_29690 [Cyclobacteriaceae bacterium]|nr:hypothetical protein [Cyclobacteriaceae bacterium]